MASFQKTTNGWRAQLNVRGLRRSATFKTKLEAAAWVDREEVALRALASGSGYRKAVPKSKLSFVRLLDLLSADEIIAKSDPILQSSGVYFLIKNGSIVYVGQSTDVHARIATHRRDKEFDRVTIIWCPPDSLLKVEAKYIAKFRPVLNRSGYNSQYAVEGGEHVVNC